MEPGASRGGPSGQGGQLSSRAESRPRRPLTFSRGTETSPSAQLQAGGRAGSRQVGTAAWRWLPPLRCRASRWVPGEVGPGSPARCLSSRPGPGQPGRGAHPGLEEAPASPAEAPAVCPLGSPWSQWSRASAATALPKFPKIPAARGGWLGGLRGGWLCWFCSPACCTSFFRHRLPGSLTCLRGGRKTIQPHPQALLCIIRRQDGVTSWRPAERERVSV